MSLDVTLTRNYHISYDGGTTFAEQSEDIFEANITHNLNSMAAEAGIYQACWRPEEIGAVKAKDIISLLGKGLKKLKSDPDHYKKFNAKNGWVFTKTLFLGLKNILKHVKNIPKQ